MLRRRKIRRRMLWLLVPLLLLLAAVLMLRVRLFPLIDNLARTQVTNRATILINNAIDQQISSNAIDYNSFVAFEKNAAGGITALRTNMTQVNLLKSQVLELVNENVLSLAEDDIGVPVGNLVMPEFFAGRGFYLPVKIVSIQSSAATFSNAFSQAGINQTLHQILMDVTMKVTILTPAGTQNIAVSSQVVVAETVIVGTVPDSYMMFDGTGQKNPS